MSCWRAKCLPLMLKDTLVLSFQKLPSVHPVMVALSYFLSTHVCLKKAELTHLGVCVAVDTHIHWACPLSVGL